MKSWWTMMAGVCLAMGAGGLIAGADDSIAGITRIATVEGMTEYLLDNGLTVLLLPDESKPTVTVNITYFVGSRHEGYGEAGMAHLLEHMLFKGTPAHPNIPALLKERGADFNGTTWFDRTNYYETVPATDANLEFALRLEADRMVNSNIAEADLKSEMTVVRNEFEQGENNPQAILFQRMLASAFEWHNYGKETIGNRSDIERVPIRNLQEFYRRHYQPDNALLIVAGRFDPAKTLELIARYFLPIESSKGLRNATYTEEPPQDGERSVRLRRVGTVPLAGVAYHIPAGSHEEFPAVQILQRVLTTDVSGRLYRALVQKKIAAEVGGDTLSLHDPGAMIILAQAAAGVSASDLLTAMLAAIDETVQEGVTAADVDRVRATLLKERELAAADSSRLAVELSDWAAQGDWRLYFVHRDRLEAVTAEDVTAAAVKYLKPDNRTVGLFEPTPSPDRTLVPQVAGLKERLRDYKGRDDVATGEQFDTAPLAIEARTRRLELPSGIRAALLNKQTRGNAVALQLTLRYGTLESLQGLRLAAELLPELMTRGTRSLERQQIEDELDRLRIQLDESGRAGEVTFSLQARRQTLPEALELLRQILREPSFPPDEFELLKQARLSQLEESSVDPHVLALLAVRRHLAPFPPDHPRYVPTVAEEVQNLKKLSLTELTGLYTRFLNGTHGELVIVGEFDPDEILPRLESLFDRWKSDEKYVRIPRIVPVGITGGTEQIETPDKQNAVYFASQPLPLGEESPEFPALELGNYILGSESLSSRLGDRIRERDGLSYGVMSQLQPASVDPYTTFFIFAISNPANLPKVRVAIREEVDRLLTEGVSAEELEQARQGWLQEQQVARANDQELTARLATNLQAGRTMEHDASIDARIAALTAADVRSALRKWIDLKKLYAVSAGDFAGKK